MIETSKSEIQKIQKLKGTKEKKKKKTQRESLSVFLLKIVGKKLKFLDLKIRLNIRKTNNLIKKWTEDLETFLQRRHTGGPKSTGKDLQHC